MAFSKIRGAQIRDETLFDAHIAATAAIATSKLADGALFVKSDGTVPFTAPVGGVDPVASSDLATKGYVDATAQGLDVKNSVRVISTADITLSGAQTIDGVAVIAGDRVLVAGQTASETNGIYVVAAGAWSRSIDADTSAKVTAGMYTFVEEGTANQDTGWVLATNNPIVLGTTALSFTQFSSAGIVQAGNGLNKVGNTLNVVSSNGGIVSSAGSIALTVDPNATLTITASGIKLADLATGKILIGDASNIATAQTMSGDATLDASGALTISASAITNSKVAANAAIDLSKLASGTTAQVIVADGSGVPTYVDMSGDATIASSGAITIGAEAVTLPKIQRQASATLIVGQGAGADVSAKSVSGDVTMDANGVFTVNASTVATLAKMVTREVPSGALNGVNSTYVLANTPVVGTESVYLNGQLLNAGAGNDYTISGGTITTLMVPVSTDVILVSYISQ
jgi:hypothetical protein